jgi:long-chain fatty acid transport protein
MWALLAMSLMGAEAGSLDYIQVSAPFGGPGSSDATAAHWNPAGLAMATGTRFHLEGAPTFASVNYDRNDPHFGGMDKYRLKAVVPFVGVASDFGVKGLGTGLSMAVPFARGVGAGPDGAGPGQYNLIDGQIQAIYVTAAAAYRIKDVVSVGAGVVYVHSTWSGNLYTEAITSLVDTFAEMGQDPGYDDSMIEDTDYGARLEFDNLSDNKVTFNVGIQAQVHDRVKLSLAYTHGTRVANRGDAKVYMGCPPQEDVLGRFGSELFGLCDTELEAAGRVSYNLPGRLNGSIVVRPMDKLRMELMGGWVNWQRYQEFELEISEVGTRNELQNEEAAGLLNQVREQARDSHDAFWVGLDVKARPHRFLGVGGRVMFDGSAVPDESVSPNNYDTNTLILGAFTSFHPTPRWTIVLGYSEYIGMRREVTNSRFGVTIDPENRKDPRYFYPQTNGVYTGGVHRVSLALRGHFGRKHWREDAE